MASLVQIQSGPDGLPVTIQSVAVPSAAEVPHDGRAKFCGIDVGSTTCKYVLA